MWAIRYNIKAIQCHYKCVLCISKCNRNPDIHLISFNAPKNWVSLKLYTFQHRAPKQRNDIYIYMCSCSFFAFAHCCTKSKQFALPLFVGARYNLDLTLAVCSIYIVNRLSFCTTNENLYMLLVNCIISTSTAARYFVSHTKSPLEIRHRCIVFVNWRWDFVTMLFCYTR